MKIVNRDQLPDLAAALAAQGYRVVAPVRDGEVLRLREWAPGRTIETAGVPVNSAKDFLLPRCEVIGRYSLDGNAFTTEEVRAEAPKTVLLGVRPCDAAGVAALDTVFNWEYRDAFYNARRAATTVVTLACAAADEECFCTSVGGGPDSAAGADAVLRPAEGGARFILEPVTAKGEALVAAAGAALAEGQATADPPASVPVRFDAGAVTEWLGSNFESPLWRQVSLACLGCGACAHVCPACHCFDIQDEAARREGVRLRNWDSCGLGLFTLHAGGHNPRPDQAARWRQRVMHKLRYFVDRFGRLACSGCGRCARLCPAGMSLQEVCRRVDEASKAVTG